MSRRIIALAMLAAASAAGQQNNTVFRTVYTALAAPATSANLPNIGQAMHLLTVRAPTATADVTGEQIRIEASYDNAAWIPISRDITTIEYDAATGAYAVERANAAYPFIRVRALAVNATYPLTVHYTGSSQPIGNVILHDGRLIGSAAGGGDRVTWGLCPGVDCAIATNITVPFIVTQARTLSKCYIAAKSAPTGAALIVDINRNGTTIFAATKLQLAAGSTYNTLATFAQPALAEGDLLTIDIDQIGSTAPGRDLGITCTMN